MELPPPLFLFIQTNKRCNLRCEHCDFWKLDDADRARYLGPARRHEVLAEFAAMNPQGSVVICGGESMLDLEDYFHISRTCRELGLACLSVINGTRVRDEATAERMIREGPHGISVSLNSHRPALHDRTRGVKGAFGKAVAALRLLVAARPPGGDTRINVMGLVFDENYLELEDFYAFVLDELGADKLKLNFLQPSFGQMGLVDPFFAAHRNVDPDRLVEVIRRCDQRFGLGLNPLWLHQVHMYFSTLRACPDAARGWGSHTRTTEHICNTYERNIMVDHYGVARLCFSGSFPGMRLDKPGDLRLFWREAEFVRTAMRGCNQFCGISHSVRRETSTCASRRPAALFPAARPAVGVARTIPLHVDRGG